MNREKLNQDIKIIEKAYKPSLFWPIFTTISCIAPYLHLLMDITEQNYDRLLFLTLFSAPLIALIAVIWTRYFYSFNKYKEEIQLYRSNTESYEW